jgi:anti-sigma factor RsiW
MTFEAVVSRLGSGSSIELGDAGSRHAMAESPASPQPRGTEVRKAKRNEASDSGQIPLILLRMSYRDRAAACLLVALAFWSMAPSGFRPASAGIDKEVVAAHVTSLLAEHLMDVPSSDRHTVKPWFAGKLDFAPEVADLSAQGFSLVGGRLDYINGRTVAALVGGASTPSMCSPGQGGADESPKVESMQGFHLLHWVRHGMAWWAVSDLAEDELRELAGLL